MLTQVHATLLLSPGLRYNESRTIAVATYNSVLGGLLFLGLASSPVAREPSLRKTWCVGVAGSVSVGHAWGGGASPDPVVCM